MYKSNICFSPAGVDACAMWRMWQAHLGIKNSRYIFSEGLPDVNAMAECDVLVVQRLMMEGNIHFLNIARAHGMKIVYDLDDDVWHLPASNPAARFFHAKESVRGLQACAEWADVITTSTKELRKVVIDQWHWLRNVQTRKEIPVIHIDNRVNFNFFNAPILDRDEDKVVIGWGGSNTHEGDVLVVWKILPAILEKYPNVFLEFVGQQPPISIRNHPRVSERPYCHIAEFHVRYATWNWDIVLAPLETHRFNRAKSSIKMQEAAIIAAPCLASDIAPYKYFTSFSKPLEWLLCDEYDWEKKLSKLIEDKSLRRDLGQLAYYNVLTNFNIQESVKQWEELASNLLSG